MGNRNSLNRILPTSVRPKVTYDPERKVAACEAMVKDLLCLMIIGVDLNAILGKRMWLMPKIGVSNILRAI